MVCAINKIDSNITGLAFAEEECLKVLPGVAGADAIWYAMEPNSFSDFGGKIKTVARSPINPSRQNKKGTITDLDVSGGFNTDFTKSNMTRLLQGFFFADARQPASTKPLNGTAVPLTSVTASTKTYAASTGLSVFAALQLVKASGFTNASNNGVKTVATAASGAITVSETLADEAGPPAASKLERIGFQFASADINIAVVGGIPSLTSTTTNFTTLPDLFAGKWVFLGDDTGTYAFANNVGYARIKSIAATSLTFDDTTWTPVNETGTGKTIRLYVGTSIKNELTPSLIKTRSYNIERQLGLGATATQAEYLEGAIANEFTLNVPQADKLNADLTFIASDNTQRSGDVGDTIKVGTRVASLSEDAYNTSSNIYRMKLSVIDPASSNPTSLFGYATSASIKINNAASPTKAVGVLGSFDVTVGNFEVSGNVEAYFTTVAAVQAVRNNADVGLSVIAAAANTGFVFDTPLLGLGGGIAKVEKDKAIMLPLETMAAENGNGYTMLYDNFPYLPNIAMPA
ncbi:MAG: phage tail tube protein [Pseudomonadota bacterium]